MEIIPVAWYVKGFRKREEQDEIVHEWEEIVEVDKVVLRCTRCGYTTEISKGDPGWERIKVLVENMGG